MYYYISYSSITGDIVCSFTRDTEEEELVSATVNEVDCPTIEVSESDRSTFSLSDSDFSDLVSLNSKIKVNTSTEEIEAST